eukprot:UN14600
MTVPIWEYSQYKNEKEILVHTEEEFVVRSLVKNPDSDITTITLCQKKYSTHVVDGDFRQTLHNVGLQKFCDKIHNLERDMTEWVKLTEKDLSGVGIEGIF